MTTQRRSSFPVLALLLTLLPLAGCGGDDNDDDRPLRAAYQVTLTNLTAAQPLSPLAAVLHRDGYTGWALGQAATAGLEVLAEGGDPGSWLAEALASTAVASSAAGTAPVAPGASGSVTLEADQPSGLRVTAAAMLVNTNDGFTAMAGLPVGDLSVGEEFVRDLVPYDAGTEGNGESAGTVPGPAAGGEGFNPARDDRNFVVVHPGVVTRADGLAGSALGEEHRFQSPVARLRVVRTR